MADRTFKLTFLGDASRALREMDKLGAGFQNMGSKTKAAVGAAAVGGAAVGAVAVKGFWDAIQIAGEYEKAIVATGVKAGASAEEQKALWDAGLRVGRQTKFSAGEAADAMQMLVKNGLTASQVTGGALDATVALAAATDSSIVTAADAASRVLGVWRVGVDALPDVVNRLAGAANASLFTLDDFNQALSQGGGAAALNGVSYQDFVSILALTSSSFASGSDAGTSYKTMFSRLNPQTKAARKEMEQLGLWSAKTGSVFYDNQGKFKGAAAMVRLLNNATKDLSDEQRIQAFQTVFGTDAIRAAGLAAQFTEADFTKLDAALGSTDAMQMAVDQMKNGKDALEQLNGAIEVIQISVGAKFLPIVKEIALALAEWLPKIPTWAILAVGAFAVLIGIVSSVALVILPIALAAGALGIGIGSLLLIFSGVGLAIAAVIAIGVLLYRNWDTIKDRAGDLWEWVTTAFGRIADFVGTVFHAAMDSNLARIALLFSPVGPLMVLWQFKDQIVAALSGLYEALAPIFAPVMRLINGIADAFGVVLGYAAQLGMGSPSGDVVAARAKYGITAATFGSSELGEYASGGIVGGPRGSAQLAIVHGGETILPTHKGGGGYGNVTVNVMGNTMQSDSVLQRLILDALATAQQRGTLGIV